jgi:serine/threonine protein kinase
MRSFFLSERAGWERSKARNSRLRREVAIKLLPEALADDAEHLARFEREAQALAALNHANIATIHRRRAPSRGT